MKIDLTPTTDVLIASQLKPPKPQIIFDQIAVGVSQVLAGPHDAAFLKRVRNIVAWRNSKHKETEFVVYNHRDSGNIEIARLK